VLNNPATAEQLRCVSATRSESSKFTGVRRFGLLERRVPLIKRKYHEIAARAIPIGTVEW